MEELVLENTLEIGGGITREQTFAMDNSVSESPGVTKHNQNDRRILENNNGSNIQTVEDGSINTDPDIIQDEAQETNFLLAKEYLDDALSNRHITFIPTAYNVQLYSCYKRTSLIFLCYFFYLVNISLALFERPNVPSIGAPYWITTIIEFVCLSYFIFRFVTSYCSQISKHFGRIPNILCMLPY